MQTAFCLRGLCRGLGRGLSTRKLPGREIKEDDRQDDNATRLDARIQKKQAVLSLMNSTFEAITVWKPRRGNKRQIPQKDGESE